jgi:hypothetical protein
VPAEAQQAAESAEGAVSLGEVDDTVRVNVSSVARFLRGRGPVVQQLPATESTTWLLRVGRGHGSALSTVPMSCQVRAMMAIELMTGEELRSRGVRIAVT